MGKTALSCLAAVLAALTLVACGGSTKVVTESQSSSVASGSASSTSNTASSSSSTSVTATTSSTSSTSAAGAAGRCVAADLSLSFLGQQGATGHGELGFELHNSSGHSCHTFGYPGVLFLTASGTPLPTASTRTTQDFFGSTPETALTLAPGQNASFRLGVTHGVSSSAGCTTAHALQVIPPDDTATLRVTIRDGAYECGTATVSPLQAGSSAYR